MTDNKRLELPFINDNNEQENRSIDLSDSSSLVIIGANGSGKTRLGAWIELDSPHKGKVHRIAAQKSLKIPKISRTMPLEAAKLQLEYGNYQETYTEDQHQVNSISWKYQNDPYTFLQNDYDKLLTLLFTEDYEKSTQYRQDSLLDGNLYPPSTKLDNIRYIWDMILPHRQLNIGAGEIRVKAQNDDDSEYHSANMSDGERVVIYLIGQCLVAKENAIIIIDEPEIHLHKAIQSKLWDEIEASRPDCLFVYITHDLDFAQTRINSKKIWLKEYINNSWRWEDLPEEDTLPEGLFFEVLGSRKPIIFVEGEKGKWDDIVFRSIYKKYTIKPVGSYSSVIEATLTFNKYVNLHKLDCYGVIDRDKRSDKEIESLRQKKIFCLDVSEIENLMLREEILLFILQKKLDYQENEVQEKLELVQNKILFLLDGDKERIISSITSSRIEKKLLRFDNKAKGKEQLENSFQRILEDLDIGLIYDEVSQEINRVLEERDYSSALKIYDNKGLLSIISPLIGFSTQKNNCGYENHLKRLFKSSNNQEFLNVVKNVLQIDGIPLDPSEQSPIL